MSDQIREVETSPAAADGKEDRLAESSGIAAGRCDLLKAKPQAGSCEDKTLPKLSIVSNTQPPGLTAEKLSVVMPEKVIEVPDWPELDSPDWHSLGDPKKGLPGEYLTRTSPRTPADARVLAALAKINPDEIKRNLEEISGEREMQVNGKTYKLESRSTNGDGYKIALEYFKEKFEKEGFQVSIDTYTRWGNSYQNLRAVKVGNSNPNEIVMFGAHIDSTAGYPWGKESKAPGADDDGSGSVALLHIGKAIKDLPLDRTVMFSLFSGEEQGLWGSRAMAELYKDSQNKVAAELAAGKISGTEAQAKTAKIIAMYQLDMIGHAPDSKTVESHDTKDNKAAHELTDLLASVQRHYDIDLRVYGAHNEDLTNRSDHYPFFKNGIPAVLITEPYDTAVNPNPAYHSADDRINLINIPYMVNVTKLATAAGVELAGLKNAARSGNEKSESSTKESVKAQVLNLMPLHARIANY